MINQMTSSQYQYDYDYNIGVITMGGEVVRELPDGFTVWTWWHMIWDHFGSDIGGLPWYRNGTEVITLDTICEYILSISDQDLAQWVLMSKFMPWPDYLLS